WSDTGECHEHTGVHRTSGRVYRVHYGDLPNRNKYSDLRRASSKELAALHTHKNEWFVRQARLILTERSNAGDNIGAAREQLIDLIKEGDPEHACRAFLTIHSTGFHGWDFFHLFDFLSHPNEHIRALTVRAMTDAWPLDDIYGPTEHGGKTQIDAGVQVLWNALLQAARSDESSLVRLTLASTIQRLPVNKRAELAKELVKRSEDADDHNLPLLVWYGLIPVAESNPAELAELATACKWPKTQRLIVRRLAEEIDSNIEHVATVLSFVASIDEIAAQKNILRGIEDGLRGWRRAQKPSNWEQVANTINKATTRDAELSKLVQELSVVFGSGRAIDEVRQIVMDENADPNLRRSALETMVETRAAGLKDACMFVLDDSRMNVIAAKGLASFNDPEIGKKLVANYSRFRAPQRPSVISILCSRKAFANDLVSAIEREKISATDLTAFDVRQIRSLGDSELFNRVTKVWGEVRDTPAAKKARIDKLQSQLTPERLAKADKSHGRQLFNKTCSKCHRLYGVGENIGPDLTGANRSNIDYLLHNILDPSAEVSKGFRMSVVETTGGQVFNGLVVTKNNNTVTLQTQTELMTLPVDEIQNTTITTQSPMPDGLLDNLSQEDIDSLFAYLMHHSQVD
ncbi:MAG: c-type cytochrome, partial [Planctomycetales bacterium]|nr:c-type cytochrome [Planctomycetales bacterium]